MPDGSSLLAQALAEEPSLAITLSIHTAPPVLVTCQICLEDVAANDGESTVALTACGHRFCIACIAAFLDVQITDGCVDLACFFHAEGHICQSEIMVKDIQKLVSPAMFAKYERFRLLRKNSQARQCPFCSVVHVTTGSKDEPTCVCSACDKTFCFLHADAHASDVSCKQFEKQQSKRERRSGRLVKRISRPCPQCSQPIQKNGGCVHMTCVVCKAEFCWWCGETWGFNYERHYSLLDAECCSGIAYEQVPGLKSPHTALRWLAHYWYYFSIVAVGIPATVVLIVILAWVWAPAVWRGEYKIRPLGLVRFIAIRFLQAVMFVGYGVSIVVEVVVIVFADGLGWLTRKLRAIAPAVLPRLQRCCPRPRKRGVAKEAVESALDSPPFMVLQDVERGRQEVEP